MTKGVKECSYDSKSVSLFDADRKNEFGKMYCIASGILQSEVDWYWNLYIKGELG
jgi:hypothetical protein